MTDENSKSLPSSDSDLRYFPRWEVKNRVKYCINEGKEFYEGNTKDISCAGACITGDVQAIPHQVIKMTIQLSEREAIRLNARILWVKSDVKNPEMGVSFCDATDDVQDSILQYAFELDKSKVVNQWYKGWSDS